MFRSVKKWALVSTVMVLLPVMVVCDVPGLDYVVETFDFEACCDYYYYDDCCDGCWGECDDEWFFDFGWWW